MTAELIRFVRGMGKPRVAVFGDLMLDEYVWGEVERISPEAPIPVLRVSRREQRVGGAGSVVVNLCRLGADVVAFGILGQDSSGDAAERMLAAEGCDLTGLLRDGKRRTTVKARHIGYVQQAHRAVQQMLRVDEEEIHASGPETVATMLSRLADLGGGIDAILISDYNKGLVTPELVRGVVKLAAERPVLIDPARIGDYSLYRGAYLICPNRFEAERASGISCRDLGACPAAARRLIEQYGVFSAAITLDRDGVYLATADGVNRHFPTRARVVTDVTGAGDMVLSVLGLVAAARGPLDVAVQLANVAAGIEIRHVGVWPVSRDELVQELRFEGHPVVNKVKSLEEVRRLVESDSRAGKTVVFTNGCFDLLHLGHHRLLEGARRMGDVLVVGVNSDASIRRLKGEGRPVMREDDRVLMLSGLEFVDYIVVFDDDAPHRLLDALRPHILVKGGEYRDGTVVGREIVEAYGGRVGFVDMVPGVSTTGLVEAARQRKD